MAQRRFRAATISDNAYSSMYPSPDERIMDFSLLNGGLNLWEMEYRLDANQSPDCVNVYWNDGCLSSRSGQKYLIKESAGRRFIACHGRLWGGYIVAHKGNQLVKINPETGVHSNIMSGLSTARGAGFFIFGDSLYYLGGGKYISISPNFEAAEVVPYIPVVMINRQPAGLGGDLYQPENRLAPGKEVWFTSDGTATDYYLPYTNLASTTLNVRVLDTSNSQWVDYTEVADVSKASGNVFQVDRAKGIVKFKTAPPQTSISTPNTVKIVCYTGGEEQQKAIDSILTCQCVAVYGGDTSLAVVLGGPTAQPNAYFWSGHDSENLNPSYFPYEYYNFAAADASQRIYGFGKQQNMLVIFSERAIGKSYFSVQTIDDRDYLRLPYHPINDTIGCDLGGSIKLIQNNLVFANTYGGVYVLSDTSAAGENAVKRLSKNINGEGTHRDSQFVVRTFANRASFPEVGEIGIYYKDNALNQIYVWSPDSKAYLLTRLAPKSSGLLYDLRQVGDAGVTSFDDGQRYWLACNGVAYLWDYTVRSYANKEDSLAWFYFENINAAGWVKDAMQNKYYFDPAGNVITDNDTFADFEANMPIPRRYVFAATNFKSYERLKDVLKIIMSVRSDTDTALTITYKTDYEIRVDKTPVRAYGWRLAPRDLTHRSLRPLMFAGTAIRVPRCFHVRHFQMQVSSNTVNTDMSIVSAQIVYRFSREDR